jgi:hypothetical protein
MPGITTALGNIDHHSAQVSGCRIDSIQFERALAPGKSCLPIKGGYTIATRRQALYHGEQ